MSSQPEMVDFQEEMLLPFLHRQKEKQSKLRDIDQFFFWS
jgi:hypothetical protein